MDAQTRRAVRERAANRCEYCRLPQSSAPFLTFHVEHVHAKQHVDDDSLSNLCLACPHCNLHKGPNVSTFADGSRDLVRLFHPREDVWSDHFALEGASIVGKTDIGRATVRLFKMNDGDQIEIRAGLILRDEY